MDYDLILLYGSFQRCISYLLICKELSKNFKIGIYQLKPSNDEKIRSSKTNDFFINKCLLHKNVNLLNKDFNYRTKILIHQQKNYHQDDINFLKMNVDSKYKIGLSGVAMGNSFYQFLPYELDALYVPDLDFYNFRLKKFSDDNLDLRSKLEVVGSPWNKYALANFRNIDYLIVSPTLFSFVDVFDKFIFLKRLNKIIRKIKSENPNDFIVYKPHNADERYDALLNPKVYKLTNFLPILRPLFIYKIIYKICTLAFKLRIKLVFLIELLICSEYHHLLSRTSNLSTISEYHSINAEIFFNSVKKGVITGRSNIIWHCLYHEIPVLNLVDESKPYLSDLPRMHTHSMKYFNVHYNPSLEFSSNFDKVSNDAREKDLIKLIEDQLIKHS